MDMYRRVGTTICAATLLWGSSALAVQPLEITSVEVIHDQGLIYIKGVNFDNGNDLEVNLSDFDNITYVDPGPTQLIAHFPIGSLAPGNYLLTITTGRGSVRFDEMAITVGAVGPEGPAGEIGPTGPQGGQGPQGETGPQGEQGLQGDIGPIGLTGPQGDVGPVGATGPQGEQGIQGSQGLLGARGEQGVPGPQGDQGEMGPMGPIGQPGPIGPQGLQGPQGDQGLQGIQGEQGIQGSTGDTGPKGEQGLPGEPGPQGDTGPKGIQGAQGPQGLKGDTGSEGPEGPPGPAGDATPPAKSVGKLSFATTSGGLLTTVDILELDLAANLNVRLSGGVKDPITGRGLIDEISVLVSTPDNIAYSVLLNGFFDGSTLGNMVVELNNGLLMSLTSPRVVAYGQDVDDKDAPAFPSYKRIKVTLSPTQLVLTDKSGGGNSVTLNLTDSTVVSGCMVPDSFANSAFVAEARYESLTSGGFVQAGATSSDPPRTIISGIYLSGVEPLAFAPCLLGAMFEPSISKRLLYITDPLGESFIQYELADSYPFAYALSVSGERTLLTIVLESSGRTVTYPQ